jgi:transposase InsO family protein
LPIPARIWTELSIDFITGLPPSNTYTNILVVTDRLSKSIIAVPMKEICAIDVAQKLLEQVFQHHGLPTAIVSDRGSQFVSMMWGEVCRLLKITRRLSTAFHPETDGATERANQELETYLRIFTAFEQDDWALQLPIAMMALNNRVTQSTGMSAFFMTHGFHQSLMDFTIPKEQGSSLSPAEKGRKLVEQWSHSADMAKTAMAIAQENQERQSNARRSVAEVFRPGDRVWLKLQNINTTRPIKKLDWIALPYRVLECVGTHAVRLNTPPGIHPVFHVSLVKKAGADPLPSQLAHDNEPGILLHNPLDPSDATTDNDGEYAVERVLRHRRRGRSWQLLVKWLGWPEPTWEPLRHLQDAVALDDYERSLCDAGSVVPWAS